MICFREVHLTKDFGIYLAHMFYFNTIEEKERGDMKSATQFCVAMSLMYLFEIFFTLAIVKSAGFPFSNSLSPFGKVVMAILELS